MTKEITKAIILQELEDKLKLREFEPSKFLFSETVIPIYNIEEQLLHEKSAIKEISITSTGGKELFVVPHNQRWRLNRYTLVPMGAGAYTFAGVYITRAKTASAFIYLDLTAGQTVSYTNDMIKPALLEPSDVIAVNIDTYTSTQSLRLYIDYTTEEIR